MNLDEKISWERVDNLDSKTYVCAHRGKPLASEKGIRGTTIKPVLGTGAHGRAFIYICHNCTRPTFFEHTDEQILGIPYGEVNGITDRSVEHLYNEVRQASTSNCHTAAVLCCRKLLMHIVVSKGAETNKSFADYVDYLSDKNYVPPDAKDWVDHIRKRVTRLIMR